jgi:hypothetical protein
MSFEERVRAIADFGFTERQARFLVTVMLHSGVCLLRQYTTVAGIVHGQKTRKFFDKLVGRRLATAYPRRHNRGRVYRSATRRCTGRLARPTAGIGARSPQRPLLRA